MRNYIINVTNPTTGWSSMQHVKATTTEDAYAAAIVKANIGSTAEVTASLIRSWKQRG